MVKKTTIAIRVPEDVKENARSIYEKLGFDLSTAINVFLRKSIECGGFPFEVRHEAPNEETLKAIKDSFDHPERGKSFKTTDQFKKFLNSL